MRYVHIDWIGQGTDKNQQIIITINTSPPPSPPALPPPPGPSPFIPPPPPFLPPPSGEFFESSQPQQPRSNNPFGTFHIPAQHSSACFNNNQGLSGNLFGSQTQTLTREKEQVKDNAQRELDDTIYELPDPPKLELGDGLFNLLAVQADDSLEQKFVNKKQ